ncbi:hypothetical protein ACTVKO_09685 [Serratia nevei]|uniref:hypothetical protein n=1 Tax=Serratia nevei TaxID=2703794 RepID=UPI003FA7E43B
MDKLREEFEEKLSNDYGDDALLKNSDGDYVDWLTADLWDYWQASRASIVVDVPQACAFNLCDLVSRDDVIESIRSIGLSIKGE